MPTIENGEMVLLRERVRALEVALEAERQLREEWAIANQRALQLQAESNGTHFVSLNNEAGRILLIQRDCVSRDTFGAYCKEMDTWRDGEGRARAASEATTRTLVMVFFAIPTILSIIALLIQSAIK
jgi:hypothetical protein